MKAPIFILGAHKSGSSLLRSLFDGHPQLFTVPLEAHFFQYAGYGVDYRLRESQPRTLSLTKVAEEYAGNIRRYHTRHKKMSDADLVGAFDMERVQACLQQPCQTLPELMDLYVEAIYEGVWGKKMPAHLRVVEKSVEQAEFAQDLLKIYPDAKFIHIIRNPYAHFVSLRLMRAFDTQRRFPFLGSIVEALHNHYYHLERNQRFIEAYRVVRYEDLLAKPEETMRGLAEYAGIPFTKTLLTPTSLGQPWGGNSSRGEQFRGLSTANLEKWRTQITNLETAYVNRFFNFTRDLYGYAPISCKRSAYFPQAFETPIIYIANRLIPYWHKH